MGVSVTNVSNFPSFSLWYNFIITFEIYMSYVCTIFSCFDSFEDICLNIKDLRYFKKNSIYSTKVYVNLIITQITHKCNWICIF